jgi:general L-amino acid transport system substrate-binding protein
MGKNKGCISMSKKILPLVLGAAMGVAASAAHAGTLEDVKAKGFVQCGVSQGLPGFSNPDAQGNWTGLDVDLCRAVAAAVFGDASAVKFTPLSAKERFTALQSGEVDILSRNTTWTMSRDTALGLNFAGVNYYDGQGFMVRKDLGVTSALELSGASVCTNTGTTTELNVADYFRANNMPYEIVAFEKADEVVAAYDAGRCDVYTTDASGLYAQR